MSSFHDHQSWLACLWLTTCWWTWVHSRRSPRTGLPVICTNRTFPISVKHFLLRPAPGLEGIASTSPLLIYNPKSLACVQRQQSIEHLNRNFVILLLPILLISCVVFEFFTINNVQQFSWLENKCYIKMPKCNILPVVLLNSLKL